MDVKNVFIPVTFLRYLTFLTRDYLAITALCVASRGNREVKTLNNVRE